MSLDAATYFQHLKAYVNGEYVAHDGAGGKVILSEKYFRPEDVKPQTRNIELLIPGVGMAFEKQQEATDNDKKNKKGKPALFHFLDDTSKPWSKRCDFVVFYVNRRSFHADCIEFKSKSLTADKIVPQLKAGACWVSALKRTVEQYTGDKQRIKLRKFVFADNATPDAYLDANRQLLADPSIRYYHFDEVQGRLLTELQNSSVQDV